WTARVCCPQPRFSPPLILWTPLSGSLSSPGYTTNLQMLAYGIQQRMSCPSSHW
uniref:Uncharacterized protein n=1 Tax=Balaenoptera musculus TaxID=9771 RepID=A0A8C0C361_BALMU